MSNKVRHIPKNASLMIGSPCEADWDAMVGDGKIRFCESCQKNVHNLSRMDDREIRRHMGEAAGHFCIRVEPVATSVIAQSVLANMARVSALAFASLAAAHAQQTPVPATNVAQEGLAKFEGSVVDASGAIIAGSIVILKSIDNPSFEIYGRANSAGKFEFSGIKPGEFKFSAHSPGFKTHEQVVKFSAGEMSKASVTLHVGELGGVLVAVPISSELPNVVEPISSKPPKKLKK